MRKFEINDKVKLNSQAYKEHPEFVNSNFANKILIIDEHTHIEPISYYCFIQGTDNQTPPILGIYLELA